MAQYPKLRTTNKGRELIASANGQKKAIEYTKAVIGNGDYSGSIDTLLDVVSPKMECSLISGTHEDGQYNLVFTVGNQNLDTGFFAKEIGIYGKIEGSSNEVLFAYTNGGTLVDYIPDKSVPIDAQTVSAYISVGDAEQVVIKKVDGTYITLKQLSDHNLDLNAHNNRFNAIIQQVNNMITNVDSDDMLAKATSLQLVKTLLGNLKIKNADDVIKAIESKKAEQGVRFDFSNHNSWYICLGKQYGNLIIQGGRQQAGEQKRSNINDLEHTTNRVVFPVSFTTGNLFHTFGIIASDSSIFWGNSSASCIVRRISNTDMRYEVHSDYQGMLLADSIIEWCVIGI